LPGAKGDAGYPGPPGMDGQKGEMGPPGLPVKILKSRFYLILKI